MMHEETNEQFVRRRYGDRAERVVHLGRSTASGPAYPSPRDRQ